MSTPAGQLEVLIQVREELAGIANTQRQLSGLQRDLLQSQEAFREMRKEAMSTGQMLTTGAGIGAGIGLFTGTLATGRRLMLDTLRDGVEFNSILQGAELGIAAVLKQSDPVKFREFGQAMAASADAIELLKQKAVESPASFQTLVQSFQGTVGAMTAAGIPLARQADLIVNMSQALAGLGIREEQILQETRALVTGNINADAAAAKILNITSADITKAKEAGKLYEFLAGKIAAFAEAGERGKETLATLRSNLGDAYQQQAARNTEQLTAALSTLYKELGRFVGSDNFADFIRMTADSAAGLTGTLTDLVRWVRENETAVKTFGEVALWTAAALTGMNLIGKARMAGGVFTAAIDLAAFPSLFAGAMTKAMTTIKAILAAGLISPGATVMSAAGSLGKTLGAAIATPMGAVIVVAIGAALIEGIKNHKLEQIAQANKRRDQDFATLAEIRGELAGARDGDGAASARERAAGQRAALDARYAEAIRQGDAEEASHLGALITLYGQIAAISQERADQIAAQNRALDEQQARLEAIKQLDDGTAKARAEAAGQLEQRRATNIELKFKALSPDEQIEELRRRLDVAQTAYANRPGFPDYLPEGGVAPGDVVRVQDEARQAAAAEELRLESQVLAIKQALADLEKKRTDELEKQAKQREQEAEAAEKQRRQALEAQITVQRAAADQAAFELEQALRNPDLDRAEREQLVGVLLVQQKESLQEIVRLRTKLTELARDPEEKARLEAEAKAAGRELQLAGQGARGPERSITRLRRDYESLNDPGNNPNYMSPGEGAEAGLKQAVVQMGSAGEQVANVISNTIGTAVDGITDGIYGWITGTMTWQQALMNIGASILRTVLHTIIQIGVQQLLIALMGPQLAAANMGASLAIAAGMAPAMSAIWAAPATLATIASYGGAAAQAPFAIAGAQATVLATSAAGFAEGGLVRGGEQLIRINERGEEFVLPADVTRAIGAERLYAAMAAIRAGEPAVLGGEVRAPSGAAAALRGASVGGAGGGGSRISIGYFNSRSEAREWAGSQEGRTFLVDLAGRNRAEMGIPT